MNQATPRARAAVMVFGILAAAGIAAGCGGDDGTATQAAGQVGSTASGAMPSDMATSPDMGMGDMAMGDPSATPADQIPGAEVKKAAFALLDTRPPGTDSAAGTAWLAQNEQGTTVTLRMSGLAPGKQYVAHLHSQSCADDNGGPHFQFDPAGPTTPPNEVHLRFTADAQGGATVTAHNDRKVGNGARAVVVHPSDAMDNRLACAGF